MQIIGSILAIFILSFSKVAWAVKHINPDAYPNAVKDQIHRPSSAQIRAFGSIREAIIGSATGDKKVAVILVQFNGASGSLTSGNQNIQSPATIDQYFMQMSTYFREVSFTKMTVTPSFFGQSSVSALGETTAVAAGVYTLSHPMEYYGCGDEGRICPGVTTPSSPTDPRANGDYLIRDALLAARATHPGLSTTNFQAVIVMHAGYGNETTTANGDIWSIFYSQDSIITSGGGGFDEGDVVPELENANLGITSPLGVICHEFGHELGLPDLYNTIAAGGTSVVGNWELMDNGPYDGGGANPSHPGAWDKMTLGWATPQTVTRSGSFSLGAIELTPNSGSLLRLPVTNGSPNEYFLVEYRSRSSAGFDQRIPGDGLLVWHVDDDITRTRGISSADPLLSNTVNTGNPHYGVSIVTADGLTINNSNHGNATNAYNNGQFFSSPQSNNFNGDPTGINLLNIRGVGGAAVSVDVGILAVSPSQSILRIVNYPNPAGKGYPHPSGEGHTTIQFQLTRPAKEYQINLYNLSGDLVRKISKDQINLNVVRSADLKWVYEYDWGLTNGDGDLVGSGVFLYLIRADGQSKTGKAVVIR